MTSMVWRCLGSSLTRVLLLEFDELAVDAGADEAFARQALDDVAEFALLRGDDRGEEHDAGFGRQGEDFIHDVAGGLVGDGLAADGADRAGRHWRTGGGDNRKSRWWWR